MKELIDKIDSYDSIADPKQFCEIFRDACKLLNLSFEDIAKHFSTNKTTATRWIAGESFPAKGYRILVVKTIKTLLETNSVQTLLETNSVQTLLETNSVPTENKEIKLNRNYIYYDESNDTLVI